MVIQVNQHLFTPMILSKKIPLFAAVACLTTTIPAGVVVADFNDLPLGIMHFDKSKSPPLVESGIGFSDAAWMGATAITLNPALEFNHGLHRLHGSNNLHTITS